MVQAVAVLLGERRSRRRAEDQPMRTVHELQIEPLTEEAFAPFGQIISTKERAPDFRTESGTEGWAVDFHSGRPLVMVLRTSYQGFLFSKLERHFDLTQTFLPLAINLLGDWLRDYLDPTLRNV